jgi:hypothetical protein
MDRMAPNLDALGPIEGILATTYELDPSFLELDLLPSCFALGAWDDRSFKSRVGLAKALSTLEGAVVLMDGRRYRGRPRLLHLDLHPNTGAHGELLHAKVTVIVHARAVRLIVASANLTPAGYRSNREVALPLLVTPDHLGSATVIREALQAMPEHLGAWWSTGAAAVREQALAKLDEWAPASAASPARFLWSGPGSPLWSRFLELWPAGEPVTALSIVSPFWSEEHGLGPVGHLLDALSARGALASGTKLRVFADAAVGGTRVCTPRVPPSLLSLEVSRWGVEGEAVAVDPAVLPEEVGGRTDSLQRRALHAKILLLEGPSSCLAYLGSANFTFHGWGFNGAPGMSNVEAGVALLRTGGDRQALRALLPPTSGDPIRLGTGAEAPAPPPSKEDDVAWPTFLRDVSLSPDPADANRLRLVVRLLPEKVEGDVQIALAEGAPDLLACDPRGVDERACPLDAAQLEALIKSKEVHVSWWANPAGQQFPVNLDPAAKLALPLGDIDVNVGERLLLAYYQGQVHFDDLIPPPKGEDEGGEATDREVADSEVDTSRIQSYQVRQFVEALGGIEDDLREAAMGTAASIRQALLGPVSPRRLGRAVAEAVRTGQRSSTAGAFQLVEIAACLRRAAASVEDADRLAVFEQHAQAVRDELARHLHVLVAGDPENLGARSSFQRYLRAVQPDLSVTT